MIDNASGNQSNAGDTPGKVLQSKLSFKSSAFEESDFKSADQSHS